MNAVLVEQKDKRDWDHFVAESPGVIAWHDYQWSDILARKYGAQFFPLATYDGARISGILPLYRIRTLRSGPALISIPHFVAGGVVAEKERDQQALLEGAIEIARKLGIQQITLKQYKLKLQGPLTSDENYYNRELELSPNVHQVWQSITEENRAKIREAEKYDLRLEYPCADVSTFFAFLLRDQHAAGVPCVSRAWVESLFATGAYEIALLRHKGELVAATMAKKFRDTVSFPFSCVRDSGEMATLCAYEMYWKLIIKMARQGIRIFHSGRIPDTGDVPGFRLGWGGTKYRYYYQYYGAGNGKTEFSTKRGRKRELVERVWKKIPVSVAGVLGPMVVRQFP